MIAYQPKVTAAFMEFMTGFKWLCPVYNIQSLTVDLDQDGFVIVASIPWDADDLDPRDDEEDEGESIEAEEQVIMEHLQELLPTGSWVVSSSPLLSADGEPPPHRDLMRFAFTWMPEGEA